jgi:ParB family chromosome partitioning protein
MRLDHADPRKMRISPLNMRFGKTAPDISDILPSVRRKGVLQPLVVREAMKDGQPDPDDIEVIAGSRRWHSAMAVIAEGGEVEPLPVAYLDPGDDAAAIEASIIENAARLDPDEVTRWQAFTRLVKEGRSLEDIAETFGVTQLTVRRILALGNLLPRIRALYGQEAIDVATIRALTLATKAQQKDWLALHDDPEQRAPTGPALKSWLFGGQSIPAKVALFDLADYPGRIRTDLFGEDGWFENADLFWTEQNKAVAALRDRYLEDGWTAVEVMDVGDYFHGYEYEKTPKAKDGKVFIAVSGRGEVTVHEGYVSRKEAQRARAAAAKAEEKAAGGPAPASGKPEVTAMMQTYIDLHRHAAARAVLTNHPGMALRLLVAHAVAGSPLWSVKVEDQTVRNEAVAESVETSAAETAFDAKRRAVLKLLAFGADDATVTRCGHHEARTAEVFARLSRLSDDDVLAVVAVVMGETLHAGGALVELVGAALKVDMAAFWSPDQAFFDLIRDRPVANAILKEVGGKRVADANLSDKVKTQKAIVRDFLDGANDRPKVENWTPKWLAFPPARYTDRPFAPVARWAGIKALVKRLPAPETEPYAMAAE